MDRCTNRVTDPQKIRVTYRVAWTQLKIETVRATGRWREREKERKREREKERK